MRSLYDNLGVQTSVIAQSDSGGSAVNGSSVDTKGYNTAVIRGRAEAASGSPTAASTVYKLQESADGSTGWADALDNTGVVIGFTLNPKTAAAEGLARIEGLGLNRKRYLRVVETTTFTAGTTPAVLVFGEILLGRGFQRPTNSATSNT